MNPRTLCGLPCHAQKHVLLSILSVHPLCRRRYRCAFLWLILSLFSLTTAVASTPTENDFFVQAEYALIDNDTTQARLILHYLAEKTASSNTRDLSLLRLFSMSTNTTPSSIQLGADTRHHKLLELIVQGKMWQQIRSNTSTSCLSLNPEEVSLELHKLRHILSEIQADSETVLAEEVTFSQGLISESMFFFRHHLKNQFSCSIHQYTAAELVCFLYQKVIDRLFLAQLLHHKTYGNAYYLAYKKHLDLLSVNAIKVSFFRNQYQQNLNRYWKKKLMEGYDILFFLQQQIFQKGLFNENRKTYTRDKFNIQENAILFYHKQYNLSGDKIWMQKIFIAFEHIKSSILETKSTYYNSSALLKELCRNVLSAIEHADLTAQCLAQTDTRLAYMSHQIRLSNYHKYFYEIHTHRETEENHLIFSKIKGLVQKTENKDLAILDFFDSQNYLFALLIDHNGEDLHIVQKSNFDSLDKALQYLKETFSNPASILNANKTNLYDFQKAGFITYQAILWPLFKKNKPTNLVVIPDGILNYIPLETLAVQQNLSIKSKYLLHDMAIRYAPSMKILFRQEEGENRKLFIQNISAFSPRYDDLKPTDTRVDRLAQLKGGAKEVRYIKDLFPSKVTIQNHNPFDADPTKRPSADLLHLAMHASSNNTTSQAPSLFFSNAEADVMSLPDISLLAVSPAVMVLNACETGQGEYTVGEGLKSIGLQFLQTGSKSTIQNLNKASDHSNAQLMLAFYEELKKERQSHRALQYAKIRFLQEADEYYAHPYFWGGLITYGQSFTIDRP